jgi:conserved oligomeric Golgi complex subunit 5
MSYCRRTESDSVALIDPKVETIASASADGALPVTEEIPLRSVSAIASYIPFIEQSKDKITGEMETMVLTGLATTVKCSSACLPMSIG